MLDGRISVPEELTGLQLSFFFFFSPYLKLIFLLSSEKVELQLAYIFVSGQISKSHHLIPSSNITLRLSDFSELSLYGTDCSILPSL